MTFKHMIWSWVVIAIFLWISIFLTNLRIEMIRDRLIRVEKIVDLKTETNT